MLTREQIARDPRLARDYAREYRDALKLVPDRDLAKDAARVNLTARLLGQEPAVTREAAERMGMKTVREALKLPDVAQVRAVLQPAPFVAREINRASQEIER